MSDRAGCKYRIYHFLGRPVFAVPASPWRLRRAGLARFQPLSLRRSAYRRLVGLSMLVGADGLFCTTADDPIGRDAEFDFRCWLEQVRGELDEREAHAVVYWNPAPARTASEKRRRVNAQVFDGKMRSIGFAKISFDAENDRRLVQEAEAINQLPESGPKRLRVPKVLILGEMAGHAYLLLESLPETARPVAAYPRACVAEYAGPARQVGPNEVAGLSWWPGYLSRLDESHRAFSDELNDGIRQGVEVCRVHGDMQSSNVLATADECWIFDWEDSCADGPVLTDEIDFHMMPRFRKTLAEPLAQLQVLNERFLHGRDRQRRTAVMMALAFRSVVCPQDATLLMRHWHRRAESGQE